MNINNSISLYTPPPSTTTNISPLLYDDDMDAAEFQIMIDEIKSIVAVIVPIMFGIIAVTGFCGNMLVILVVLFNKQMHSTTNLLIVNLAMADLLFVIFCIPFTAVDYVLDIWPFGDIWCRGVQYLIVVFAYVSIYTLVLMSIDRFLAVVYPIHSRMLRTEHTTKLAIFILWSIILTICIPVTLTHGVVVSYHKRNQNKMRKNLVR